MSQSKIKRRTDALTNVLANARPGEDITQKCRDALKADEQTYWNGEPTPCRKVFVRMAATTEFPQFWGKDLLGQEVPAVEVTYGSDKFYLYDGAYNSMNGQQYSEGHGWRKVTLGFGGPEWGHCSVPVDDPSTVRIRESDTLVAA